MLLKQSFENIVQTSRLCYLQKCLMVTIIIYGSLMFYGP